jgi:hypothetical protein
VALRLQSLHGAVTPKEATSRMRKLVGPILILVLAVLHAPQPAQALLYEYFPSTFLDLGANEPVMLLVTGLALLGLGRAAAARSHGAPAEPERSAAMPVPGIRRSAREVRSARRAA